MDAKTERRHISHYRVKGVDKGWWVRVPKGYTYDDAGNRRKNFAQEVFYHHRYGNSVSASLEAARKWRDSEVLRQGKSLETGNTRTALSRSRTGVGQKVNGKERDLPDCICDVVRERKLIRGGTLRERVITVATRYRELRFRKTYSYGKRRTRDEALALAELALAGFRKQIEERKRQDALLIV